MNPDLYRAKIRRVYLFLMAGIVAFTIQAGIVPQYARATTYAYGVGLSEQADSGAFYATTGYGVYCYPSKACFPYTAPDGIVSVSHFLSKSGSRSAVYNYPLEPSGTASLLTTASGSATENGLVNMGAIHLESTGSGAGEGGSGGGETWGVWSDILTIGKNFSPDTPLKFQVTLDLTGSLYSQSQPLEHFPGTIGSGSYASAQSYLAVSDISGLGSLTNNQSICQNSQNGKTSPCKQIAFGNFSGVLVTHPGDHIMINDVLSLSADASGAGGIYSCGQYDCFESVSATATSYFLDTSLFTFTPITPGAFYTSASGTVYSGTQGGIAATPEPSALALFGTGVLLMGVMAYRRKKAVA